MTRVSLRGMQLGIPTLRSGAGVPVPENFTITGIASGIVLDTTPEFTWSASAGAVSYTLQYGTASDFTGATEVTGIVALTYTPAALAGAKRYARVKAVSATSESEWSGTLIFTIPYIYDPFTAADATNVNGRTPTITTAAAAWVVGAGSYAVSSNKALAGAAVSTASVDASVANCEVRCLVTTGQATGTNSTQLMVRATDASNGWLVALNVGSNALELYEFVAGVATLRDSELLALAANTTYTVVVTMSGQTITATLNGGSAVTYGSAAFSETVTKHGMRAVQTGTVTTRGSYDDFRVTAL